MRYQTLFSLLLAFIFTGCGPSAPKISIHEAVERGDIKTLKEHLEVGTDVNTRKDGRTCLHTAAWLGHTELAKLLIAGGAELDSVDDKGVLSPLHAAMAEDHFELVELLISEGADLNAVAVNGHTPLSLATVQGNREVVILLRRHLMTRR